MAVQVRLFAALREAAGTAQTEAAPGSVAEVLAELSARYGEPFTARVAVAAVLVDGRAARPADAVGDGAEVVLLPPVSGGSVDQRLTGAPASAVAQAVALPALLLAALAGGRLWLAGVLAVVALAVAMDVVEILAAAVARPVVVAAAAPGLGLPIALALRPDAGWEQVPAWMAGVLILACGLLVLSARRQRIVTGLGATLVVALVVGFGAAGLLLVAGLPDGGRWLVAVLGLVTAAELGAIVAERVLGRPPVLGAALGSVGAGAVGLALLSPPLDPATTVMLVVAALLVAVVSAGVSHTLLAEAGRDPATVDWRLGGGGLLGAADAVLLVAPVAYVLGRASGL